MGSLVHRSVPTNLKWFLNCSPAHTLFQDRFKDAQVGSSSSVHKKGLRMTQVDQRWGLFDHQFFNATEEDPSRRELSSCLGQASVSLGAPRMPTNLLHHGSKHGCDKGALTVNLIQASESIVILETHDSLSTWDRKSGVWSSILAVKCFAGWRMELYATSRHTPRLREHLQKGLSGTFPRSFFLAPRYFFSFWTICDRSHFFSFNFWETTSVVSLGEKMTSFLGSNFSFKLSQNLSFLEFVAGNSWLTCVGRDRMRAEWVAAALLLFCKHDSGSFALKQTPCHRLLHDRVSMSWHMLVLPSVSKVAGVWRSLFWCLESVMVWRGIMGTKFGDKRVNDLDLLSGYVVRVACLHREIHAGGSACSSLPVRLDHLFFTCRFCLQCFVLLPSAVFMYKPQNKLC